LVSQPGNTEEGFLGPDYIDSMFFTPSTSYVSPNINDIDYSFLSNQEYTSADVRMIHQNPKLKIVWKHMIAPFNDCENILYNLIEMINKNTDKYLSSTNCFRKYQDFDNKNYSTSKYMDIMKTMEKEFMPKLLLPDEWIKLLDAKTEGVLSRHVINERINDRFKETVKIDNLFHNRRDQSQTTFRGNILPYDSDTISGPDVIGLYRDDDKKIDDETLFEFEDDDKIDDEKQFLMSPHDNSNDWFSQIEDHQNQTIGPIDYDIDLIPPHVWHMTLDGNNQ
jgi:hypothetical protein